MMSEQKFRGVSWKFLVILVPTAVLTVAFAIAFYMYVILTSAEKTLLDKIEVIAEVHGPAVAYPLWTLDVAGVRRSIDTFASLPEISCIEVFEQSIKQAYQSPEHCSSFDESTADKRGGEKLYTTELFFENQSVGQLNVFYTIDPLTAALNREILFTLLFSLLLVGVISVVAYTAMHLIVARPLRKLITAIKQSDGRDDYLPVKWAATDELGGVVKAYNNMIQRVADNTDELVAARQQAESAAQTKSRFLANMSHELRTPLNAVIGITEMLKEQAEEDDLDTEPYERITGSGRHLLRLIDDVLDFSKIEANKIEITLEPVNLFELIEDVTATVQPLADDNNSQLTTHYSGRPEFLVTDPLRLCQILLNLMGNACKFTQNGNIELIIEQRESADGSGVLFAVRDNGIGIAHDKREHLFKDFSQADSSTTRQYGGTGLGLAISQRLCGLLGGEIVVKGDLGKGSEFSFVLPVVENVQQ